MRVESVKFTADKGVSIHHAGRKLLSISPVKGKPKEFHAEHAFPGECRGGFDLAGVSHIVISGSDHVIASDESELKHNVATHLEGPPIARIDIHRTGGNVTHFECTPMHKDTRIVPG